MIMCYSPITIVNPTKYVSLRYRDRFLLRVPCGKCAECQDRKKREYYLRAYYHARSYLKDNGFVYFDTLTYAPGHLPTISQYFPTRYNFSCFDSRHIRLFMSRLRQRCKRLYKSNFEYFLSSEYGTSESHTHRPHYHVLFFVKGKISPLDFSSLVASTWQYGRTDGRPYKSDYYVLNNVLNGDTAKTIRVLKYVTKYISKSCLFTKEITRRVNAIMFEIARLYPDDPDWINSLPAQLWREKLLRHIGQFHRQSTGFGLSLLGDLDLNQVFKDGTLKVVDNDKIVLSIPLPTYYKRKLFYDLYEVDGTMVWCPSDLGVQYLESQRLRLVDKLKLRYSAAAIQAKLSFDIDSLVDYVVNVRGRIKADLPESTILQRLDHVDYYKYATRYDRHHLGKLGLVKEYLGNSTTGYNVLQMPRRHVKLFSFGNRFSYFDHEKEKLLDRIDSVYRVIDHGKQQAYELRQRLVNVLRPFLANAPIASVPG